MRVLYVVRHGQTEWNVERRLQGHMDSPLTEQGRQEALATGVAIRELGGAQHMFVSPSGRTRATAAILNGEIAACIDYENALLERSCGAWEGMTIDELERADPQAWQARVDDPYGFRPPGGENLHDMRERSAKFLAALAAGAAERVVLVTHGVMSKIVLQFFLRLDEPQTVALRHPNDLAYRLTFDGAGVTAHHFAGNTTLHEGVLRDPQTVG